MPWPVDEQRQQFARWRSFSDVGDAVVYGSTPWVRSNRHLPLCFARGSAEGWLPPTDNQRDRQTRNCGQ
jgi:hypothetical protein